MLEIFRDRAVRFSAGALFILYSASLAAALITDGLTLLALKSAISEDPTGALHSWIDSDRDPCGWTGVTCRRGRVTAVDLSNCSLTGYLPSELSLLSSLQSLSLPRNRLSGPIAAAIGKIQSLAALDLSHNNFTGPIPASVGDLRSLSVLDLSDNGLSGPIPAEIGAMDGLERLDLSSNQLNGLLPPAIAALPRLSGVLNLSCNLLHGPIPPSFGRIPVAVSLDLRLNNLSGEIPPVGSLLNQGPTAFAGNPGLCGFPLKTPCSLPKRDPTVIPPLDPYVNPSSSDSRPVVAEKGRKPVAAIPILAGVVLAAIISVLVLQWQFRKRREATDSTTAGKEKGSALPTAAEWREGRSGEIYTAVDDGFGLELEELLRASAYVVGKSHGGIVYKVVVARGSAVAVRRLSEAEDEAAEDEWRRRRAFELEAAAIGRTKHPNVVALRAYYYAPDEKLLIYDYIANGTLYSALYGGPLNPTAPSLPWAARLAILQGVARGLAYLHECSPRKYIHGNIRTSKVLLDDDLRPYISGFGLTRLTPGTQKFTHSGSKKLGPAQLIEPRVAHAAYVAPESRATGGAVTQRCDVYAFGVVMLEVLTGRPPGSAAEHGGSGGGGELEAFVRRAFREERPLSEVVDPSLLHEVHAKKEVLAVFHVALGCTEPDPESRPKMRAVCDTLDRTGSTN